MLQKANFSDLPDFGIGHCENMDWLTGCTVIVAPEGATCGVDVRGGGPATRETDLLKPENMVEKVHAICLSGGSAFGLEASCGVMETLSAKGIGFSVGPAKVPIVPSACIFDLLIGQNKWPTKEMGAQACLNALESFKQNKSVTPSGNVGGGCGATVGKLGKPEQAMKSGFGYSGVKVGEVVIVACVIVNALGNVINHDSTQLAGVLGADGTVIDPLQAFANNIEGTSGAKEATITNTTIGCILTNANLTKAQCTKCSQITHDAYARAIKPVHTLNDGDTIFTMAAGKIEAETDFVAILATEVMEEAIRNAVTKTDGAGGLKAVCNL